MTPSPPIDHCAAPALQTRNLTVGYRTRRGRSAVLERMNLTARAGELVCLLGANGSGKSTLLRTLVRLQPALEGRIELAGVALTALTHMELARRVGLLLTERVLIDTLPAIRIVELGRYAHSGWWGHLTDADRQAVQWAIESVGAGQLASRDFSRLSDGERQRVMIARALAQEPSLLVLDEPSAFLDVTARAEIWALLRHLATERRLAIVVSTHDLDLALRMASVVWVIMPDRNIVMGTPQDIVAAGVVDVAFSTRDIRFHTGEPAFRLTTVDERERTEQP
jgi:iron complex transport system ATP-binding protein